MITKEDILNILTKDMPQLQKQFKVRKLALFGSYARGDQRQDSDVDILVEVDPSKPVVFTWDRVLDFEKNSAPYIQYSHARACSIIKKASKKTENPDYSLLTSPLERDIILMLARFPEVFIDAAENLQPNEIADFANALADKFNKFYAALPVIKADPKGLSDARLLLVNGTRTVLRNALSLLGIEAPERM